MKTYKPILFFGLFLILLGCKSDTKEIMTEQASDKTGQLASKEAKEKLAEIEKMAAAIPVDSSVNKKIAKKEGLTKKDSVQIAAKQKNAAEKKEILIQQFNNSVFLKQSECCTKVEEVVCCCKDINSIFDKKIDDFLAGKAKAQELADFKNDPLYIQCVQKFDWFSTTISTSEQKLEALEEDEEDDW